MVADRDKDDIKAFEQEIEDRSGTVLSRVQEKQKLIVNEESSEGTKVEKGDVKILQAELDTAKSTMEQLSTNLRHHRKESNMLYMQVQAVEEQRVSHEAMKKTIADLKEQNASLKNKIQGEAMLVSAIDVLQNQLE